MLTIAGFGRHEPPSDLAAMIVSAAHFARATTALTADLPVLGGARPARWTRR
jgi:hypothetical protein